LLCVAISLQDAHAAPRQRVDLNAGWSFLPGDEPLAIQRGFDDSHWQKVDLPHTWNAQDGQDGGANYRRGAGWYRRTLTLDRPLKARRLYLQFDGASLAADVYVNGRHLGTHVGGFARFRFDATEALEPGANNLIAVRVDNDKPGIAPTAADFTFFGGLYRGVSLLVTDRIHIAAMDHASPGVYLVQRQVTAQRAEVLSRVQIESHETRKESIEVRTLVFDAAGHELQTQTRVVALAAGGTQTIEQPLTIEHPHLWNGVADPYLYRVRVELRAAGRVRDVVEQPLGLRYFRVDSNEGLFLNGKHLSLRGVNRHQDRIDKGWAIGAAEEAEDFALLQELGANAIRVSHYQQSDSWYERADRGGLVVWAEIPFVGEALSTPEFIDNAQQQLRELIRQNFNHPAIFFWGVGNETRNDAVADSAVSQLASLVRAEDPTRLSTYASDHPPEDPRNWHTTVTGWNKYFGWYYGDTPDLGPFLDSLHAAHPEARIGLSEYGAGASIHQHSESPSRQAITPAFHPEEYQNQFHEAYWRMLKVRPFVWGSFVWNLFDFASDGRNEGDTPGRNDKGLVTYDRKTRKDAYYFYKANWSADPVLYITSRRFSARREPVTEVKIYSNAPAVELFVNGASQGTQHGVERVFHWQGVKLAAGQNAIEARATIGTHAFRDACIWYLLASSP
jgi:beta-galactosidase